MFQSQAFNHSSTMMFGERPSLLQPRFDWDENGFDRFCLGHAWHARLFVMIYATLLIQLACHGHRLWNDDGRYLAD
jgi:hypothetical protein